MHLPNVIWSIIIGYASQSYKEWASYKLISKTMKSYCNHRLAYEHITLSIRYNSKYESKYASCVEKVPYTKTIACLSMNDVMYTILSKLKNLKSIFFQMHTNHPSNYHLDNNINLFPYWNNLQELFIANNFCIDDSNLQILLKRCTNLYKLSIGNCPHISDIFDSINSLSNLKLLHLSLLHLSAFALQPLSRSSIQSLEIGIHRLWNTLCDSISFMSLISLSMGIANYDDITDELIVVLASNNLQFTLKELTIKHSYIENGINSQLTDSGILSISLFKNLKVIVLKNCRYVTDNGIVKLIKELPFLSVICCDDVGYVY